MNQRIAMGVTIGLTLALSGCATIIGGSSQTVTVNSNVTGAEVKLNETVLGVTPLVANIKRGQTGILSVAAPGYNPYQIAINKKISSLFWVNILSGGVFGSTTDYASGAMYEYDPSTYMVSLQRRTASATETEQWRRTEGLRAFVLQNKEALVSDLAAGKGEYLEVLARLLKTNAYTRKDGLTQWRADYAASKTANEFAQMIVEHSAP